MVVAIGGGVDEESKRGQIYGNRRRLNFGWLEYNVVDTCIIKFYTWNLYDVINQCYYNKYN